MERNTEISTGQKRQDALRTVQAKLLQSYQKGSTNIPEIIEPGNDNDRLINLNTTTTAPKNPQRQT